MNRPPDWEYALFWIAPVIFVILTLIWRAL
jgi:hypothetical protein